MGAVRVMSTSPFPGQLPLLPPLPPAAAQLLTQAHRALAEAESCTDDPRRRYATAHLAALRAAAAVLAARTRPEGGRRRPRSAWVLLGQVAPELAEWAAFFAAGAGKRAAAEAGLSRAVTEREADDLLRDAGAFLTVVAGCLGQEPARPRLVGSADGIHPETGPRQRR